MSPFGGATLVALLAAAALSDNRRMRAEQSSLSPHGDVLVLFREPSWYQEVLGSCMGRVVRAATTWGQGRSLLSRHLQLIVSEAQLPDAQCFQVLAAARDQAPPASVVIVGERRDPSFVARVAQAGAAAYLVGPFGTDELAACLRMINPAWLTYTLRSSSIQKQTA